MMDYSILEICPRTPSPAKLQDIPTIHSSSFQKFLDDLESTGGSSMDFSMSRELFVMSNKIECNYQMHTPTKTSEVYDVQHDVIPTMCTIDESPQTQNGIYPMDCGLIRIESTSKGEFVMDNYQDYQPIQEIPKDNELDFSFCGFESNIFKSPHSQMTHVDSQDLFASSVVAQSVKPKVRKSNRTKQKPDRFHF